MLRCGQAEARIRPARGSYKENRGIPERAAHLVAVFFIKNRHPSFASLHLLEQYSHFPVLILKKV